MDPEAFKKFKAKIKIGLPENQGILEGSGIIHTLKQNSAISTMSLTHLKSKPFHRKKSVLLKSTENKLIKGYFKHFY